MRFIWREKFVEGFWFMRTEIIEHYPDADCIRIVFISDVLHAFNPIYRLPLVRDFDVTPASQRFSDHEEFLSPVAVIVMIDTFDRSRLIWERVDLVLSEEFVRLIEAHNWPVWIGEAGVRFFEGSTDSHVIHSVRSFSIPRLTFAARGVQDTLQSRRVAPFVESTIPHQVLDA